MSEHDMEAPTPRLVFDPPQTASSNPNTNANNDPVDDSDIPAFLRKDYPDTDPVNNEDEPEAQGTDPLVFDGSMDSPSDETEPSENTDAESSEELDQANEPDDDDTELGDAIEGPFDSAYEAINGQTDQDGDDEDALSVEELKRREEAIQRRIQEKQKAEKQGVIDQIVSVVKTYEISTEELVEALGGLKIKRKGVKAVPKYRDPATGTLWSGRGKEPAWIKGKDRKPFLIANQDAPQETV